MPSQKQMTAKQQETMDTAQPPVKGYNVLERINATSFKLIN